MCLGHYFFEIIVNHNNDLDMLKGRVKPMIKELYDDEEFYFQQDRVPQPFATKVSRLLNESLPGK